MLSLKRMNKRGQEGPNWLLITLVIGGVVALIAILFFTGVFDKMGQAKDALPGQLSFKQSSCETVLKQELIAGACYEFMHVGNNHYVNCFDERITSGIEDKMGGIEFIEELSKKCDTSAIVTSINSVCAGLNTREKKEAKFNNGGGCTQEES